MVDAERRREYQAHVEKKVHAYHADKMEKVQKGANIVDGILSGIMSFGRAITIVLKTEEVLTQTLRFLPWILACLAVSTLGIWLFCLPLRWPGWVELEWHEALQISLLIVFPAFMEFTPQFSGKTFFAVLSQRDVALSNRIHEMKKLRTLRRKIFNVVASVVIVIISVPVLVMFLPFIGNVLLLAVPGIVVAGHAIPVVAAIGFLVGGLMLIVLVGLGAQIRSYLQPIIHLWNHVDPIISLVAIAAVSLRWVRVASIGQAIRESVQLYMAAKLLTLQLLAPYSQRLEFKDWDGFKKRHKWHVFGFGLPVWALTRLLQLTTSHILIVLAACATAAGLEVLRGAAGSFLYDLLASDDGSQAADQEKVGAEEFSNKVE